MVLPPRSRRRVRHLRRCALAPGIGPPPAGGQRRFARLGAQGRRVELSHPPVRKLVAENVKSTPVHTMETAVDIPRIAGGFRPVIPSHADHLGGRLSPPLPPPTRRGGGSRGRTGYHARRVGMSARPLSLARRRRPRLRAGWGAPPRVGEHPGPWAECHLHSSGEAARPNRLARVPIPDTPAELGVRHGQRYGPPAPSRESTTSPGFRRSRRSLPSASECWSFSRVGKSASKTSRNLLVARSVKRPTSAAAAATVK